jgi:hypothetical protein
LAYDSRNVDPRPNNPAQPRGGVRPAHPLPEVRSGKLDYDRYLQTSSDKFQIFSAGERRRHRRTAVVVAAVAVAVLFVVAWAIASQG